MKAEFLIHTSLALALLFGVFFSLLNGRAGVLVTTAGILLLMAVKHLPFIAIAITIVFALSGIWLESRFNAGLKSNPLVLGSALLLFVLGIFFSPVTSFVVWVTMFGLSIFPLAKQGSLHWRRMLFTRFGKSIGLFILGLYAIYV